MKPKNNKKGLTTTFDDKNSGYPIKSNMRSKKEIDEEKLLFFYSNYGKNGYTFDRCITFEDEVKDTSYM
jgi:hypothetical protein